jgi:hypothetical protein
MVHGHEDYDRDIRVLWMGDYKYLCLGELDEGMYSHTHIHLHTRIDVLIIVWHCAAMNDGWTHLRQKKRVACMASKGSYERLGYDDDDHKENPKYKSVLTQLHLLGAKLTTTAEAKAAIEAKLNKSNLSQEVNVNSFKHRLSYCTHFHLFVCAVCFRRKRSIRRG